MLKESINPTRLKLLVFAILLSIFMSSLDQTIVATALPTILKDLGGFNLLSWIYASYILTSTIAILVVGRLSDIYGRKTFYLLGIVVFVLGSALSGLSHNITELIIFRALQGIGGGALTSLAFASVGDLFPPRERGKWQGVISSSFGVAAVVGPLIGGYLTTAFSWNWIFYINVPIGIVAFLLIFKEYPNVKLAKDETVDYIGIVLLTIFTVALISALIFGGSLFAWTSIQEYSLWAIFVVFLAIFVIYQAKVKSPILPLELFHNKSFVLVNIVAFLTSFGFLGGVVYLPIYFQYVRGVSPTVSGLYLISLVLGLILTSIFGGLLLTKYGKYKFLIFMSVIFASLGFFLLSHLGVNTSFLKLSIFMFITGVGLGGLLPILSIVAQNYFPVQEIGVVTGALQFFRNIASAVGLAAMGAILNNTLIRNITLNKPTNLPPVLSSKYDTIKNSFTGTSTTFSTSIPGLNKIPKFLVKYVNEITHAVYVSLSQSVGIVMLFSSIVIIISLVFVIFIKQVPLRTSNTESVTHG
jgi:EmrB/QacA subfamily drug resistance transporter